MVDFLSKLPESFKNIVVSVDEEKQSAKLRANVTCMNDIDAWVSEFSKLTSTMWIYRVMPEPKPLEYICRKSYRCQRNGFRKNKQPLTDGSTSYNCTASINIIVKAPTAVAMEKDPFMNQGYPAIVSIVNRHTHPLMSTGTLEYLPTASDIRSTFEHYFSLGYGIADSLRFHRVNLNLDDSLKKHEAIFLPSYRIVRHWHQHWVAKRRGVQNTNDEKDESGNHSNVEVDETLVIPTMSKIMKVSSSIEELGGEPMDTTVEEVIPGKLAFSHSIVKFSEFLDSNTLPKSFMNKILYVDDVQLFAQIRSDINCREDCNKWIREFEQLSFTRWIMHSYAPNPPTELICRRTYVCHHSNLRKKKNPNGIQKKNFNCKATINIVVENAANESQFVQEGLPALITIQNTHSHATTTAAAISFLPPTSEIQTMFERYFSKGLGVAASLRYYKGTLKGASSSLRVPKYGTIKHWYRKWRAIHPLPRFEDATTVADEELSDYWLPNVTMTEYLNRRFLPKSFTNRVINVNDGIYMAHIRSDVNSVQDCLKWIKEFGKRSSTDWVSYTIAKDPPPGIVFRKSFVCHHSSFQKKKSLQLNGNRPSKNFNCEARITFGIQSSSEQSKFIKEGLPALIVFKNAHNHPIRMQTSQFFRPMIKGIQVKFNNYFSKGFGPAGAIRFHRATLKDKANEHAIPNYNTVQTWYMRWKEKHNDFVSLSSSDEVSDSESKNSSHQETAVEAVFSEPQAAKTSSTPIVVKISTNEATGSDFQRILEELNRCHRTFGSSKTNLNRLRERLKKITSREAWESFLHGAAEWTTNNESAVMSEDMC